MNNKLLVSVALVLLFGVGIYLGIHSGEFSQNTEIGFKTYSSPQYGFEFQYPANWKLQTYNFGWQAAVAVDPVKLATQKELETLDMPAGLITLNFGKEKCSPTTPCSISGIEKMEKVTIGEDNSIKAVKIIDNYENGSPNPAYLGKHTITYYFDDGGEVKYGNYGITYISDAEDKYLNDFNQIISSLKILK